MESISNADTKITSNVVEAHRDPQQAEIKAIAQENLSTSTLRENKIAQCTIKFDLYKSSRKVKIFCLLTMAMVTVLSVLLTAVSLVMNLEAIGIISVSIACTAVTGFIGLGLKMSRDSSQLTSELKQDFPETPEGSLTWEQMVYTHWNYIQTTETNDREPDA